MSRRAAASPTAPETPVDRLQTAVDELADNVRILTDIVGHIREDLSWLTRNGVPHQPLNVLVHRMPLLSDGVPREGGFEFSLLSSPSRDPTAETLSDDHLRNAVIDEIVDRLAVPLGQMAQEQLNALLSVLDESHRKVLQAIRDPQSFQPPESRPPVSSTRRVKKAVPTPNAPTPPADPPPPPGQLF